MRTTRRRPRRFLLALLAAGVFVGQTGCAGALTQILPLLSNLGISLGPLQKLMPIVSSLGGNILSGTGPSPGQLLNLTQGLISGSDRARALSPPPVREAPAGLARADTVAAGGAASAPAVARAPRTAPGFTPTGPGAGDVMGMRLPRR